MNSLLESCVSISKAATADKQLLEVFSKALLTACSETEDNVACVNLLGLEKSEETFGLGIANVGLLSEIVNCAEGSAIPKELLEYYPQISQEQWDAVLRVCTVILVMFEGSEKATQPIKYDKKPQ